MSDYDRLLDVDEQALVVWAQSRCHPDPHSAPKEHRCEIQLQVVIDPHTDPLGAIEMLHEAAMLIGKRYGITVLGGPIDPLSIPRDNPFGIDIQKGLIGP